MDTILDDARSYKMVLVVRDEMGVKMGKGKTAAQVAHAAVMCTLLSDERKVSRWMFGGQKKVVLRCNSLAELEVLELRARELGLTCVKIRDMGLTQLDPHTVTCLGIGPEKGEKIDEVTGYLKLLN